MKITKKTSVRTQTTKIIETIIANWKPSKIWIGTGDHDKPTLIDKLELPKIWEKNKNPMS